jgi:RNA polymerase sigma factor (sigma-70 family)
VAPRSTIAWPPGEAVELADGAPGPAAVADAAGSSRAPGAPGLGIEATVVASPGPTGAGKSTPFNTLAGAELVAAGRRRPTTSTATAAVWGDVGEPLLDWLEVPLRHRLDGGGDRGADGLVLLDLPDFDSVERRHRNEVDRLVPVVDLLVWVVDPQKYADGSLHDRYLRPLAPHREQMLVVLNQADLLAGGAREQARRDLAGLLERDGLPGVPVLAVSARTRDGLDVLERALRERVERREAAAARLGTDAAEAAGALAAGCAGGRAGQVGRADRDALVAALAGAAGVPTVVLAVERTHRRRGALGTGWPVLRWVRRLRPDPLGRLRLGGGDEDVRTSLPGPTPVQRAGVGSAARGLATSAAGDLPDPWPALARRAATAQEDALPDRLDRAVAGADLKVTRPKWWLLAGGLQRLLALAALVGLLWLVLLAGLGLLRLEDVLPLPDVIGLPLPTLLLGGGVLLGLLLAALTGAANRVGAGGAPGGPSARCTNASRRSPTRRSSRPSRPSSRPATSCARWPSGRATADPRSWVGLTGYSPGMSTTAPRRAERRAQAEALHKLWRQYQRTGDAKLRDRLILTLAPMVKFIVYRKVREVPVNVEAEDYISVGLEALMQSIDRYDPEKGATLEQYAWTAHPRRGARRAAPPGLGAAVVRRWERDIEKAVEEFTALHGRRPRRDELSDALGCSESELQRHRDEIARSSVTSLNAVVLSDDEHGTTERGDLLASDDDRLDPEQAAERNAAKARFRGAFAELPQREREVAVLMYVKNLTLAEVGEVLGVSESRVCQIHGQTKKKLRTALADDAALFHLVA